MSKTKIPPDLPFLGEIIVEEAKVYYSDNPPRFELDIVQIERGETRSRLVIRFSELARLAILSALEEILIQKGKKGSSPNRPKSLQ